MRNQRDERQPNRSVTAGSSSPGRLVRNSTGTQSIHQIEARLGLPRGAWKQRRLYALRVLSSEFGSLGVRPTDLLVVEPGARERPGQLVIVRGPDGLALRKLRGHQEPNGRQDVEQRERRSRGQQNRRRQHHTQKGCRKQHGSNQPPLTPLLPFPDWNNGIRDPERAPRIVGTVLARIGEERRRTPRRYGNQPTTATRGESGAFQSVLSNAQPAFGQSAAAKAEFWEPSLSPRRASPKPSTPPTTTPQTTTRIASTRFPSTQFPSTQFQENQLRFGPKNSISSSGAPSSLSPRARAMAEKRKKRQENELRLLKLHQRLSHWEDRVDSSDRPALHAANSSAPRTGANTPKASITSQVRQGTGSDAEAAVAQTPQNQRASALSSTLDSAARNLHGGLTTLINCARLVHSPRLVSALLNEAEKLARDLDRKTKQRGPNQPGLDQLALG